MGLHKPFDRHLITNEGAVKLSGGSINLAAGQFAIVDIDAPPTKQGMRVLSDFSGVSRRNNIELKLGKPDIKAENSRFLDNFPFSSVPFKIEDIVSLKVDAPDGEGDKVDDFIVGFNGKPGTELTFDNADNEILQLHLSGDGISYAGYQEGEVTVQVLFDAPNEGTKNTTGVASDSEWTDQEVVENAIDRLKRYTLIGNQKLTDFVDIIPVNSLNPASLPGTPQTFYHLELEDDGTLTQLARVQAQYPTLDIKREVLGTGRTKYTTIAASLPSAYSVSKVDLLKGCDACPAGYTELAQGFVYQIEIEDDGTDVSDSIIEAEIPGVTANSAVKNGQNAGVGYYTVVTDDALTQAEIDTFVTSNPTAIVLLIAENVVDLCTNSSTVDTAWVAGGSCNATTEIYTITLADECDASIFDKVQAAYPDLTIQEGNPNQTEISIRLVGTSGTAVLSIGDNDYTITFDTDLETTVDNFVAAEAANILADTGFTLTDEGAVQDFRLYSANTTVGSVPISVANATGDLAGNGTQQAVAFQEGCQTQFYTTVTTNLVCDECDPIFRELFESEAPHDYNLIAWEKLEKQYNGLAKMGIRFRAKRTILAPSENFRDDVASVYDSIKMRIVGGFTSVVNENYKVGGGNRFNVKILERYKPVTHLGMHLRCYEDMSRIWFDNTWRHVGNNYAKFVYGEETLLKATAQYVDYALTIHKRRYAQSASDKVDEGKTYHIIVEFGRHQPVEDLLNRLAAAAGVPMVQATSK